MCEHFLPGFRAGGPIRSIAQMLEWLGPEFEFWVVTRDHDLGESQPFATITRDAWLVHGQARVCYVSDQRLARGALAFARELQPDVVYLNGWFAPLTVRTLWIRRLVSFPWPVVVAPRGEFNPGAFGLKQAKKALYLALVHAAQITRGIWIHATAETEIAGIQSHLGARMPIALAPNLPAVVRKRPPRGSAVKRPGEVDLIFFARVSPMKNLEFLFAVLGGVTGVVRLAIVGPEDDPVYSTVVREAAARLPRNVTVVWEGPVGPTAAIRRLGAAHVFVLPTLGENHGHAIVEAWTAGVPVLISDRTPWRRLPREGGGWDESLDDQAAWARRLQACVDVDEPVYSVWCDAAWRRAEQLGSAPPLAAWRAMFSAASIRP